MANSASLLEGNLAPLTRGALRHDVTTRLLAAVFSGEMPPGTRLIVQKLAKSLGVSSTPVREALVELEAIGIVKFLHNRGAVIGPFGPKELREIYQLRRILEAEATRAACGQLDRAAIAKLRDEIIGLAKLSGKKWAEVEMSTDRQLHDMIATHCGSMRLADEIRRYNLLVQAGREIVGNRRHAQEVAMKDHLAILEALLAENPAAAAQAMGDHIDRTAEMVCGIIFPQGKG
jgi:DNA-binding GntR family transcriptional regulator